MGTKTNYVTTTKRAQDWIWNSQTRPFPAVLNQPGKYDKIQPIPFGAAGEWGPGQERTRFFVKRNCWTGRRRN
jgi:hypothetical protein